MNTMPAMWAGIYGWLVDIYFRYTYNPDILIMSACCASRMDLYTLKYIYEIMLKTATICVHVQLLDIVPLHTTNRYMGQFLITIINLLELVEGSDDL